MAFAFRKDALPEEFEAEHGTIDLTDDTKPGAGGDDGEDEDLDLSRAKQRVWLCKVSLSVCGLLLGTGLPAETGSWIGRPVSCDG